MLNGAGRRARIALTAALALLATSLALPARARPAQTTWTTYLRAGPGLQYAAIDEIDSQTTVDVQECRDGWCRVEFGRAFGYIDAGVVQDEASHAAKSAAPAPAPIPCFQARQSGYGVGDELRFCGR